MMALLRRSWFFEAFSRDNRPPAWFWLLPAAVALLRSLPLLWLHVIPPPDGMSYLGISYIPKDFLAYLAFVRQTAEDGSLIYDNPFTTDPQTPRFILLFQNFVGLISRCTGLSPNAAFEWSRIPLTFLFFAALWAFLRPILTDKRDRLCACALVAFSGGFEALYRACLGFLPKLSDHTSATIEQSTQWLMGWNTFASSFNPMWIAALVGTLFALRVLLTPDVSRGKGELFGAAVALFLTYWIHPYTAIGIVAIVLVLPLLEIAVERTNWQRVAVLAVILAPTLALIALIGRWQSADLVYRASSNNVFGEQEVPIFWYPLTLGAVGFMALRGAKEWAAQMHPWRFALLAWVLAIALLHSSPLINGYKFVFLLHLPLCIVAAGPVRKVFAEWRSRQPIYRWRALGLGFCLFISAPLVTWESLREVVHYNAVPTDYMRMVETMSKLPGANALVPPRLGNILPAFTAHRVWAGQWFLTPRDSERRQAYERLTSEPRHFAEFERLLADQRINYLVVPAERSDWLVHQLGAKVKERVSGGSLTLLILQ